MIVLRNKFFNNSSEEDKKKEKKLKAAGMIAGGLGASVALPAANNKAVVKLNKHFRTRRSWKTTKNELDVRKKLLAGAERKGVTFINDDDDGISTGILNSNPNIIVLGNNGQESSDAIAHELGHREHMIKGGSGSKIGKLAHKIDFAGNSKHSLSEYSTAAAFLNGIHSGYKKEKNKEEGKKTSKFVKYKTAALPVLMNVPRLIGEFEASRKGLKLMKDAGANSETLKEGKKALARAYGSYLSGTAVGVGSGYAGELVGKGIKKLSGKSPLDEKEERMTKEQRKEREKRISSLKFRDWARVHGKSDKELKDERVIDDPKSSEEEYRAADKRRWARNWKRQRLPFAVNVAQGALLNSKTLHNDSSLPGAIPGAINRAVLHGAVVGGTVPIAKYLNKKRREKIVKGTGDEKFKNKIARAEDRRKVALGEMDAAEFRKKWYKK